MTLARRAALLLSGLQWNHWERQTRDPAAAQKRLLREIVQRNQDTAFGRDHGFASITSVEDFRRQVPIGDYENLRPYIERAKQGEKAVLTSEPILMFTMTSGSTGEPKLIPVTESTRANHTRLTRLWYSRAFHDHPGSAAGKVFGLVGRAVEGHTAGGIPYGAASGLIYQSSPTWIKRAHALPYEIAEIKDFQAKYYAAMRVAIEQDVTFLGTPNPSTILRLVETADRFRDEIIKDTYDGTLSDRFELAPTVRALLAKNLSPNRHRAQQLEQSLAGTGRLRPIDYWPHLQLIGCWKGGSVGVRLKELPAWFGERVPARDLGYMASEAQMSLPVSDSGSGGILAVDGNFYEFIPESEIASAHAITLGCDELELGGVYYPILTTAAGLYRYDINDVIRVAGFHGKAPLVEFLRKGRDVTNITGEKLHVNHVIQAMEQAQRATGAVVRHFRAFADMENSRYAFMVECDGAVDNDATLSHLLAELDACLFEINVEYADKRKSARLQAPVLCVMKHGWYERKAGVAHGASARDVQFKAQLLSVTPEDPSEIIAMLQYSNSADISKKQD
jgi:GH3 auxin-responsive promoter